MEVPRCICPEFKHTGVHLVECPYFRVKNPNGPTFALSYGDEPLQVATPCIKPSCWCHRPKKFFVSQVGDEKPKISGYKIRIKEGWKSRMKKWIYYKLTWLRDHQNFGLKFLDYLRYEIFYPYNWEDPL